MNHHYLPQLLLRQFGKNEKVYTYEIKEKALKTKKIKHVFMQKDLFDTELEVQFSKFIEGPFGDLLNHKLLTQDKICITRRENLLMRKFLLLNSLRSPLWKMSYSDMVKLMTGNDESQAFEMNMQRDLLKKVDVNLDEIFGEEQYQTRLKKIMELNSLEELNIWLHLSNTGEKYDLLEYAVEHIMASYIGFWDSTQSEQEFIFPKTQGIGMMDYRGHMYKYMIAEQEYRKVQSDMERLRNDPFSSVLYESIQRRWYLLRKGSLIYSDNFSIYPISPTRTMICFSPYFRGFFWETGSDGKTKMLPPVFSKAQFNQHFYEPMRMELFKNCRAIENLNYEYQVKNLTSSEVLMLNSIQLDVEPEEFVFRDFNKIRDSFWYYDHQAKFARKKKNDYSNLE